MKKKLSIIIPVYNCEEIGKAIESIPEQEEIELLVIDGKSGQATIDEIERYRDRIDYFVSEKDQGLYDAMNKGVQKATGEWILTLAADDRLICNPLGILKKYGNDRVDVICGRLVVRDFSDRYFIYEADPDLDKLLLECTLRHPAAFFRKTAYEKHGKYDLRYRCGADREFFLRLYKQGAAFRIIPDLITLFSYGGVSTKTPFLAFREDVQISDRYEVSRLSSRKNYLIRIVKYYGAKGKDFLHLSHRTKYMDAEKLKVFLQDHPEVNRSRLFDETGKE